MRILVLAAAIALAMPAPAAAQAKERQPQPKAMSISDCQAFTTLALLTASLVKQKVSRKQIEGALQDVFTYQTDEATRLGRLILDAAIREIARGTRPQAFAAALATACVRDEGDMSTVLGKES